MFVGAGETTLAEPLSVVYPRLAPEIGHLAAGLTGTTAWVTTDRARRVLDWTPKRTWRADPETWD